jgi:hypothetical protein
MFLNQAGWVADPLFEATMSHASSPSSKPLIVTVRSWPDLAPFVVSRTTGIFIIRIIRLLPPVFRYEAICRLASGSISFVSHFPPGIFVP